MIRAGDVLENPISRETFVFTRTAADTNGDALEFLTIVRPGGAAGNAGMVHIHPLQTETFVVRKGEIAVTLGGRERVYAAGETAVVPAGTSHTWRNAHPTEDLEFVAEFRPALHWEAIFESVFALVQMGRTRPDGSIPLLQMAVTLHRYPDHYVLPAPSRWLQRALFALLSPLGRMMGYKAQYEYVRETPPHPGNLG